MTDTIATHRLILRRFTRSDAGHLFELDSDPAVMRWLSGGSGTPMDVIEGEILPLFMSEHITHPGLGFWAAEDRETGAFVGWFCLRPSDVAGVATMGYRLRRAVWGRGLATEGGRHLLYHAFAVLELDRVLAQTYEENMASRRVMEKLGMCFVRSYCLTMDDLAEVGTFTVDDEREPWDGDDVEYAIDRTNWYAANQGH